MKILYLKNTFFCFQRADVNGTNPNGAPYDQCCTNEEIRALIIKYKKSNK